MANISELFFAREDYEAIRQIMNADLPDTYDGWLQIYEQKVTAARRSGDVVVPSPIKPDELSRLRAGDTSGLDRAIVDAWKKIQGG